MIEAQSLKLLAESDVKLGVKVPRLYYHQCWSPETPTVITLLIMEDLCTASAHVNMADGMNIQQVATVYFLKYFNATGP